MRKFLIVMVMVAVLAAACSSDDDSSSTSSSSSSKDSATTTAQTASVPTPVQLPGKTNNEGTQDVTEKPSVDVLLSDFFFSPTFIEVTTGQSLSVHLANEGQNAHTFTSTALNMDETLQPGETKDVAVTVPAGSSTEFHCSFHQSAGMQGSFFVSP